MGEQTSKAMDQMLDVLKQDAEDIRIVRENDEALVKILDTLPAILAEQAKIDDLRNMLQSLLIAVQSDHEKLHELADRVAALEAALPH